MDPGLISSVSALGLESGLNWLSAREKKLDLKQFLSKIDIQISHKEQELANLRSQQTSNDLKECTFTPKLNRPPHRPRPPVHLRKSPPPAFPAEAASLTQASVIESLVSEVQNGVSGQRLRAVANDLFLASLRSDSSFVATPRPRPSKTTSSQGTPSISTRLNSCYSALIGMRSLLTASPHVVPRPGQPGAVRRQGKRLWTYSECALRIQRRWRYVTTMRKLRSFLRAVRRLQAAFRGQVARRAVQKLLREHLAAAIIQNAWARTALRRWTTVVRIQRFYRARLAEGAVVAAALQYFAARVDGELAQAEFTADLDEAVDAAVAGPVSSASITPPSISSPRSPRNRKFQPEISEVKAVRRAKTPEQSEAGHKRTIDFSKPDIADSKRVFLSEERRRARKPGGNKKIHALTSNFKLA